MCVERVEVWAIALAIPILLFVSAHKRDPSRSIDARRDIGPSSSRH
jgi:hypothetical protein